MRCPKCGFISFDHLTSCSKCGKDIAEVAAELQGTSIKVEAPMFLAGALSALADSAESFEEQEMETAVEEEGGIDFHMDMEEEAPAAMAEAEEDVDFSFEEEAEEFEAAAGEEGADITLAEAEAEEAAEVEEEAADFEAEAEAEEEAPAEEAEEDSFVEELDFLGGVEDEEEGGLEFDLEDFIDMDHDKSSASSGDDTADLDLGDEEK